MSYGTSVREIRAMEIGIAADHVLRDGPGGAACRCGPCETWRGRVLVTLVPIIERAGVPPTPLALAMATLCGELRLESDEAPAP